MPDQSHEARFAAVSMTPKGQNLEAVQQIVSRILKYAGCGACGRLAALRLDFLSDPPSGVAHENVISFVGQGLKGP